MKPAFSTIAAPDWTLERTIREARRLNYAGLEMRTFGFGETLLAADPCHTDGAKLRTLFDREGVQPLCLATSLTFDRRVTPPVIGLAFGDYEAPIRQCKRIIDHAADIGALYVRVFGFSLQGNESRRAGLKRIASRLQMAVDGCRNTGVRVVVENGGSFASAEHLAELIAMADMDNLLGASYSVPVGRAAGDTPASAARALGDKLLIAKVRTLPAKDSLSQEGQARADVEALAGIGFGGWVVVEHDRLWAGAQGEPGDILGGFPPLIVPAAHKPDAIVR